MQVTALLNPIHVHTVLDEFLASKYDAIQTAMTLRGGWEGWAQLELAFAFLRARYTVEREAHIFTAAPRARVDLLLGMQGRQLGLEVKCETSPGENTFAHRVDIDLTKIVALQPQCPAMQLLLGTDAAVVDVWGQLSQQGVNDQRLTLAGSRAYQGLRWLLFSWPNGGAGAGGLGWP